MNNKTLIHIYRKYIYIYFIQNYTFTTGAPAGGIPASVSNIYDTNKDVIYTNILSKKYI